MTGSRLGHPRVHGPITGGSGRPYASSVVPLGTYGYGESEYFVSGRTTRFAPAPGTSLGVDGRWQVTEGPEASWAWRSRDWRPVP